MIGGLAIAALAAAAISGARRGSSGDDASSSGDESQSDGFGMTVSTQIKGRGVALELAPIGDGKYLAADVAPAYEEMRAAAEAEGVTFKVNSAWRSNAEQAVLREKYEAALAGGPPAAQAAPVGFSNHEAGRAVDIDSASGSNAAFTWLTKNASRFGFRRTVPAEPWHWEYVQ